MDHDVTFRLASGGERGTFVLSQEGLDLVRCLVLKWIMQAEKGETSARELAGGKADTFAAGQASYFRNAASFLLARLTSHLTSRVNIREQLAILTRWQSEEGMPPRWEPYITHADQTEADDGTLGTPLRWGGSDCDRDDGKPPMESGLGRPVEPAASPPVAPNRHPAEGGDKARPTPQRKGKRRTRPGD